MRSLKVGKKKKTKNAAPSSSGTTSRYHLAFGGLHFLLLILLPGGRGALQEHGLVV